MVHYEMRFSGTGGQGMMLMGDVMAQAAGIAGGNEVVLTKSYGPESRGGACRSELIVDEQNINYPVVAKPDFVLAMSQLACDQYITDLKEDGVLLLDSGLVRKQPEQVKNLYAIPLTQLAVETTGKAITANVVALGAISVLSPAAQAESILDAVLARFPEKLHAINQKAFEAGAAAAKAMVQ